MFFPFCFSLLALPVLNNGAAVNGNAIATVSIKHPKREHVFWAVLSFKTARVTSFKFKA